MKININKKRRRISAKGKLKLQHTSINKKKKRRISAKDEEETTILTRQQHLSNVLPHDIMLDILSRLPVEPLLRFRSVSRSWNYLIRKDHYFINMHLSRSQIQPTVKETLMFFDTKGKSGLYSLDYNQKSIRLVPPIHRDLRSRYICTKDDYIWGICNGLICTGNISNMSLCISNPSTAEYRKVPYFKGSTTELKKVPCTEEIFEFSCHGFGYNPNADDYVVLKLTTYQAEEHQFLSGVTVYSLRNNSWRRIQNIPYEVFYLLPGQFVNGSLHWLAYSKMISIGDEEDKFEVAKYAILAFEITTENFLEVPMPESAESVEAQFGCFMYVSQYQGKFCLFQDNNITTSLFDLTTSFDLWVMNEYRVKESWVKLFNIQNPDNTRGPFTDFLLCLTKEGSILMQSYSSGGLILYDLKDTSGSDILDVKIAKKLGTVHSYVPSISRCQFD
ncbi:hypothetical protein AQUCO_00900585v1 [Aquilegia coerulea]|uniref:F-box domain-containing protein n=1 Tax=Aquilegia coerulea TaxID=218851 RepID=A0A2G5EEE2_AQUCA|nr:hypothetical protein AQUCO_00900585v1 [Aquilegia coerulea]